jgi:hypothetical protein
MPDKKTEQRRVVGMQKYESTKIIGVELNKSCWLFLRENPGFLSIQLFGVLP